METPPDSRIGIPENNSLRVHLLESRWIVENERGESVGEAADREEAVKIAKQQGRRLGCSGVTVCAADGQVEETLDV